MPDKNDFYIAPPCLIISSRHGIWSRCRKKSLLH